MDARKPQLLVTLLAAALVGALIAMACGGTPRAPAPASPGPGRLLHPAQATDNEEAPDAAAEALLELRVAIALAGSTDETLHEAQSLRDTAAGIVAMLDDASNPEAQAATPEQRRFAASELTLAESLLGSAQKNTLMAAANLAVAQRNLVRLPSSGDAPDDPDGPDDAGWVRPPSDLHRAAIRHPCLGRDGCLRP